MYKKDKFINTRYGKVASRFEVIDGRCVIPDGVTEILESEFKSCTELKEIVIPDSVASIGEYAFYGCTGLCEMTLPDGVTSLGAYAFAECTSLRNINLPDSIYEMGKKAFARCSALESITIPNGMEVIDEEIFYNCSSLVKVDIPDSVTIIRLFAFRGCPCEKDITYKIDYKYSPKKKGDLVAAIRAEIKAQGSRANLNCIDTSLITNMHGLFSQFKTFEGDIRGWNVSNVTDMSCMFYESQFNGDISQWDVSNVMDMSYMFYKNYRFDRDISKWNVGNVINMEHMFSHSRFRGNISGWNVDKAEYFFPMFKWADIPEKNKPLRFQLGLRDGNSPVLSGKKVLSEDASVDFSLSADGTLTISGNLDYDADNDENRGLSSLPVKKLVIAEGVTRIGDRMFSWLNSLEDVTFPESLQEIGVDSFDCLRNLKNIHFPSKGLVTICAGNFGSCQIRELHLPSTLQKIGSYSFDNLDCLEEIELPESITSMGGRAFRKCKALRRVKLPSHLITIPESAFYGCEALEDVAMPSCLEVIEKYAFSDCPNLRHVDLPDSVKKIDGCAFDDKVFTVDGLDFLVSNFATNRNNCSVSANDCADELDIPSSVCYEGRRFVVSRIGSFSGAHVKHVRIPETITSIDEEAFAGCTNLRSIELPDSVTELPESLFSGCWRLRNVRLGSKTTTIGPYAFRNCEFLQHLHIPDTVKHISIYCFEGCKNLVDINMPASLECLGTYALEDTPLYDHKGPIYVGNVLCGFGGGLPEHTCLEVREGTTVIAEAALRGLSRLESVILPDSLQAIGYEAFNDCNNLKHIHMSKSLRIIGDGAFGWTSITEVELPWEKPIEAEYKPFPGKAKLYVPVGSLNAYKADKQWGQYQIEEKENCAADPSKCIDEGMEIVGRPEAMRVILIEKAPCKHPWKLYGEIVPSKSGTDPRRIVERILYEAFRDTAMFLDWEEDRDAGHGQPLSEILEYNTHRFAVVDLPVDATPETKQFNGRTYLTDEALYKELSSKVIEWTNLE